MKFISIFLLTMFMAVAICAQRPRTIDTSTAADATKAAPPAAPQTMNAKYEGGIFGYNKTMEGTLTFDDTNQRLLFRKDQKDLFFIPYNAVTSTFADTQKRRPSAATVARCNTATPILAWRELPASVWTIKIWLSRQSLVWQTRPGWCRAARFT